MNVNVSGLYNAIFELVYEKRCHKYMLLTRVHSPYIPGPPVQLTQDRVWPFMRYSPSFKHMSHDMTKPTKWHVCPAKTQIRLGIRPVWSESLLSAWEKLKSLATRWKHSEVSDQTGRMPRLIRVFAVRTVTLLVLSCHGSIMFNYLFVLVLIFKRN